MANCEHKFIKFEKEVDLGEKGARIQWRQCPYCYKEEIVGGIKFKWNKWNEKIENMDLSQEELTIAECEEYFKLPKLKDIEINDETPIMYEIHPYGL